MDVTEQLLIEIEDLRKQLHKILELSGGDLLSEEVIKSSQKLDKLLVEYLKEMSKKKP